MGGQHAEDHDHAHEGRVSQGRRTADDGRVRHDRVAQPARRPPDNRHHVPHFLPGQNSALGEGLKAQPWIPAAAARGGIKTTYPEYQSVMSGKLTVDALTVPSSRSAVSAARRIA